MNDPIPISIPARLIAFMTQLPPELLELVAERFRALSEPARLRILSVLMEGERTVSELVDETELNQANVSKHLALLRSLGFVERRKEGLYAYYRLADPSVGVLCEIMCGRLEEQAEEQSALLATGS
jgi:DNA-binding transcriptional ArsR family regulator